MSIDQEPGGERIVEVSLRMKELSTLGRVVRLEPDTDPQRTGRVVRERVRPGSLLAFGCVVREPYTPGTYAKGRVPREPHP
jgi:hypothetical protein